MSTPSSETDDAEAASGSQVADSPEIVVIGDDDIATIIRGYVSDAGYDVSHVRDASAYADRPAGDGDSELVILNVTRSMLDDGTLDLDDRFTHPNVAVLATSGPTITASQVSSPGIHLVDWLTKPFQRTDLIHRMEEAIEGGIGRGGTTRSSGGDGSGSSDSPASATGQPDHAAGSTGDDAGTTGSNVGTTDDEDASIRMNGTQERFVAASPDDTSGSQGAPAGVKELEAALDRIEELDENQRRILDRIQELDGSHEAVRGRIEELETNHGTVAADVEALTERFTELSDALTAVHDRLDAIDERTAGMDDRADAIEADIAETRRTVDSLSDGLDALADEQQRLTDRMEEASRERAELRSAIEALTEWQADVSTAFTALRSDE